MKKIIFLIVVMILILISGCKKEIVECDKLGFDGECLSNCHYSENYEDNLWYYVSTEAPEPYVREYCFLIINVKYKQNDLGFFEAIMIKSYNKKYWKEHQETIIEEKPKVENNCFELDYKYNKEWDFQYNLNEKTFDCDDEWSMLPKNIIINEVIINLNNLTMEQKINITAIIEEKSNGLLTFLAYDCKTELLIYPEREYYKQETYGLAGYIIYRAKETNDTIIIC